MAFNSFGISSTTTSSGQTTGVVASDGQTIYPDSLTQTLAYDGSGNLTTITVSSGGNSYVQTLSYTSGNLTSISPWVKQ